MGLVLIALTFGVAPALATGFPLAMRSRKAFITGLVLWAIGLLLDAQDNVFLRPIAITNIHARALGVVFMVIGVGATVAYIWRRERPEEPGHEG